jgi:hypothetical protein
MNLGARPKQNSRPLHVRSFRDDVAAATSCVCPRKVVLARYVLATRGGQRRCGEATCRSHPCCVRGMSRVAGKVVAVGELENLICL